MGSILDTKTCPAWYYRKFKDFGDDENSSLSIVRLPEELNILPKQWAQSVEAGWRIKIRFEGDFSYLEDEEKATAKNDEGIIKKNEETSRAKGDEETVQKNEPITQDITNAANLYQQDLTSMPDFVRKETFRKPLVRQSQTTFDTSPSSVLCEVRNVYKSRSKMHMTRDGDEYARIENDDILGFHLLEVHSKPLLHALHAVLQFHTPDEQDYDQGFRVSEKNFTNLQSGRFRFPYLDLYHHLDKLIEYKTNVDRLKQYHSEEYNKECDHHIDILIKYLNDQPNVALSEAKRAWNKKVPITTFSWLWLLLKPGSDVYVRERGQMNAYVIESIEGYPRDGTSRPMPYQVKVWNLDYDGRDFGRSSKTVFVHVFDGEREIQSLTIFPVRFHKDKEGDKPLRDFLIERGKTFVNVVKQPIYQEYTGSSSFSRVRMVSSFHRP